ncbi:MAG: hypothetical protein IPK50_21670 [Fibrobacterota bacterium]|nr:MAG: hypothetical protein IPK50_21670 [Fibrobacterota bacterium]
MPLAIVFCDRIDSAATQTGLGTIVMICTWLLPAQVASQLALYQLTGSPLVLLVLGVVPLLPFAARHREFKGLLSDIPTELKLWRTHKTLRYVDLEESRWIYQKYSKHSLPLLDKLNLEGNPLIKTIMWGAIPVSVLGGGLLPGGDNRNPGQVIALFGIGFMTGPAMVAIFGSVLFQSAALAMVLRKAEKILGRTIVKAEPEQAEQE